MFPRIYLIVFLVACLSVTCRAEDKKKEQVIIQEISHLQLTVSRSHELHMTYTIPKDCIITFEGMPATVEDLRAGMMVTIRADESGKVALAIRAHSAPRTK